MGKSFSGRHFSLSHGDDEKAQSKEPHSSQHWVDSQVRWCHCSLAQWILPSSPSCTAPLATSWRATGKILCSATLTLSDKVATVSPLFTGTASWRMICPASTSSWKRKQMFRTSHSSQCSLHPDTRTKLGRKSHTHSHKVYGTPGNCDPSLQDLLVSI